MNSARSRTSPSEAASGSALKNAVDPDSRTARITRSTEGLGLASTQSIWSMPSTPVEQRMLIASTAPSSADSSAARNWPTIGVTVLCSDTA